MAFLAPIAIAALAGSAGAAAGGITKKLFGFRNGGKVPKTGIYALHKGEVVVPSKLVNKISNKQIKALKHKKPKRAK